MDRGLGPELGVSCDLSVRVSVPLGPSKKACGLYPGTVAEHGGARSAAATAVGWLIVLIVGWIVLRVVVGTLGWAFRGILVLVALFFLLNLYFRLKARDE